jgi:hypothetical protein
LGKSLCPACVDEHTPDFLADCFEGLHHPGNGDDVCVSNVVFGGEATFVAAAMTCEMDAGRLEVNEGLNYVAWTYRPLSIDRDVVSFFSLLYDLLNLTYLLIDTQARCAHRIGSAEENSYD